VDDCLKAWGGDNSGDAAAAAAAVEQVEEEEVKREPLSFDDSWMDGAAEGEAMGGFGVYSNDNDVEIKMQEDEAEEKERQKHEAATIQ
jgi:hypothetical protein